jgi:putative spermidine/putrescine transport system ATP-binding protein
VSNDQPYVQFKNVQKSYDGVILVVKGFNLDVAEGEFITMLGPSGSGKTTCLMMLAGFETATHGDIILDGQSINDVAPHKRNIGMVFQNYALFPHMTVAENLMFPLEVRNMPKSDAQKKVQKALDMVQMGSFGQRRPGQLSGGQQQRVAVARALVFDAKLVLMDEPLGALDKQLREQMQYEIKHIHDNLGVTVVYVTHDQSEALTMSDRIAVFDDGVVKQLASPSELYGNDCRVDIDGHGEMIAQAINIGGVGDMTTLSLRPERVWLDPDDTFPNVFEGKVEELIYLGDHIRTRMTVCGHDEFIVKIPNSTDHKDLQVGDTTKIGWKVEDCRALDCTD